MATQYDDAIAGAGVIGLAHAFHLARRGRRVVVFERNPRALGASIRNFGLIWPIGMPPGNTHKLAIHSRNLWVDVLGLAGLWHKRAGSLHLAYHDDEAQVLEEFSTLGPQQGYACKRLEPTEARERVPAIRQQGLKGALWSETEVIIDPRQVIASLPAWLHSRYGVEFKFGCAVQQFDSPWVYAGGERYRVNHLYVCSGDDLTSLYPRTLAQQNISVCKLQMMRSQPYGEALQIAPSLSSGLSMRQYPSFADCPSIETLRSRIARESPELDHYGIHVLVSQNATGELVIGDSHEYGSDQDPFINTKIETLILDYLHGMLEAPNLEIRSRWTATYAADPTRPYIVEHPEPDATIVTGLGGRGMTLSLGLADLVVANTLGESERPAHSPSQLRGSPLR